MTIEQIRTALADVEQSFSISMDNGAESLAMAILAKRDQLWNELVQRIQAMDPYTTEADIRYFEHND